MQKKILISETTREERQKIVAEANAVSSLDSLPNVSPRLEELNQMYIDGDLEIDEIDRIHSTEIWTTLFTIKHNWLSKQKVIDLRRMRDNGEDIVVECVGVSPIEFDLAIDVIDGRLTFEQALSKFLVVNQ